MAAVLPKTSVSFALNGKPVTVEGVSPLITLNEWLRVQPGLTGTKKMCSEGGCGCCVVAAKLSNGQHSTVAINSCLCPLYAVEGWTITTVEGIGNSTDGFHEIQRRLVDFNGSQCGYCTPGFVMSMYSLLQANPSPSQQKIEDIFDGNICRCTGYRPILDAMKSFGCDSTCKTCTDIEDLGSKTCSKRRKVCSSGHSSNWMIRKLDSDPSWYSPSSLSELARILEAHPNATFRLLAGDTGRGVYKDIPKVDMLVSLSRIAKLKEIQVADNSLTVGAGVTLTELIDLLQSNLAKSPSFSDMASHISRVANTPVRNRATWAGNVMLTHQHEDFPSDIFLLLAASQAVLSIVSLVENATSTCSMWEFLSKNMSKSVILSVEIPFLSPAITFASFKIMPRAENAKAAVNAAFTMEVDSSHNFTVKTTPTLVIGGGEARPVSCSSTASFFTGKSLLDPDTLKGAMEILSSELDGMDNYMKGVAQGLLYKFYLSCIPGHTSAEVQSASSMLTRPLSSGSQTYDTNTSKAPVGLPISKLEGLVQASGEAQYTTDISRQPDELYGSFVLATKCNADILSIDVDSAEQMSGCVRVVTAKDIPEGGVNNCISARECDEEEMVFAEGRAEHVGQAIALVIAETPRMAEEIAKKVYVKYGKPTSPPLITTRDAVNKEAFIEEPQYSIPLEDIENILAGSERRIKGEIECGSQYHFTMETQNCLVVPHEDGYTVYSSTQWVTNVQQAVARILGVPNNNVHVTVKRVGGAYGSKIRRPNLIAAACALGACATGRPVRVELDLETNMKLVGKRFPYLATYEVGCTNEGMINAVSVDIFANSGIHCNDESINIMLDYIDNAYHVPQWNFCARLCRTNTAANTYCRSPGSVPAIFIIESMMEHVAMELGMDIESFRRKNLYEEGQLTPTFCELEYCQIRSLWDQLYQSADIESRKQTIASYNKANRWKKRGLSMVPLKFQLDLTGLRYPILVNIYKEDGTVSVSHGGVEIGQGINTKVAQVAAMTLGIPMEMIKPTPCSTLTNANTKATGGSTTSEAVCHGTKKACEILNDRIKPVRKKKPDLSWPDLIARCFKENIDLSARYYTSKLFQEVAPAYNAYGVTATEVELDVLTGQIQIPRVDILYDCGDSMNPEIDIGQVEGAFVMGLGYFLMEKMEYDLETGEPTTVSTWDYKPPLAKDIPIDFRVELLKNAPNPTGVLGSKAAGEPPFCMSCSALFAVKRAIEDARRDMGTKGFFALSGPATIDSIYSACLVDPSQFTL